jgi:hypothetical protein
LHDDRLRILAKPVDFRHRYAGRTQYAQHLGLMRQRVEQQLGLFPAAPDIERKPPFRRFRLDEPGRPPARLPLDRQQPPGKILFNPRRDFRSARVIFK